MTELKLNSEDKEELLKFIDDYSKKISISDIEEIESKLNKKLKTLQKNKKRPAYTIKMIRQLEELGLLLEAPEIAGKKLDRVISALHYFIWAEDKIADYIPVVGYLDDAFIVNVVHSEVRREVLKEKKRRDEK